MKPLSISLLLASAFLTLLSGCAADDDRPHQLTGRQEAMVHGSYEPTGRLSGSSY